MIRSTAWKYRPNQCFSLAKTIDSSSILQITDNDPVVFLRTLGGWHDRAGRCRRTPDRCQEKFSGSDVGSGHNEQSRSFVAEGLAAESRPEGAMGVFESGPLL
jgi:hypothetical protein